jgi:hypothetical protein
MTSDSGTWAGLSLGQSGLHDGAWHHVAVVQRSKSDRELFIDGLSRVLSSGAAGTLTVDRAVIGSRQSASTVLRYFQGPLDDARIYNRALSATEVQSLTK